MKKLIPHVALALSVPLMLTACSTSGGDSPNGDGEGLQTVSVIHVPSTLFAPLYVAEERGYFEDEGLQLELEAMQAGQDAIPLVASGQADVLVAGFGSGLFSAINDGLGVKVVASMGGGGGEPDNSPTALMVSSELIESGEISDVSDLEGRTLALSGGVGGAGAYQLQTILDESGLTLDDIEAVNLGFGDMAGAIEGGSADAALPPAPFTTAMEESGIAEAFDLPPAGTIASGVLYGEQFIDSDLAQPFYDALVRGADDLEADPYDPEILEILATATGQELDVLESNPTYVWFDRLAPAEDQLEAQQAAYRTAGLFDFDNDVPVSDIVDVSFSDNVSE